MALARFSRISLFLLTVLAGGAWPSAVAISGDGWLEKIDKNLWQDRSTYRCYQRNKVKTQRVKRLARIKDETDFYVPPVLAPDGSIVAMSKDGRVYVLSNKGKLLAKSEAYGMADMNPMVLADGTIVVVTREDGAFFINPDGTLRARVDVGKTFRRLHAVASENTVVIADNDRTLYFLRSDGVVRQTVSLSDKISAAPILRANKTVAVGSRDKRIYIFGLDGQVRRSIELPGYRSHYPELVATGPNDRLIALSFPDTVHVFRSDGTPEATFEAPSSFEFPPAFLSNGRMVIMLSSFKPGLFLINLDGTYYRYINTGHRAHGDHPPLIWNDDIVLVSKSGGLYFLHPDGVRRSRFTLGTVTGHRREPVLLSDGTAVVGWEGGYIYFVSPDGELKGKFDTRTRYVDAKLLALPDDRVVAATNSGEIFLLKLDKRTQKTWTWEDIECPRNP